MKLRRSPFARVPSGCLAAWLFVGLTASLVAADLDLQLVGQWPGSYRLGYARAVAVAGHYAYVAADVGGLHVIDITDPAHPRLVGALIPDVWRRGEGFHHVTVSGNYAYVSAGTYATALLVIDISQPTNPQRVGVLEDPGGDFSFFGFAGMAVSGNFAYLTSGVGIHVVDISDPANPRQVGDNSAYPHTSAARVSVSGRYAYVTGGNGLEVIDVSDPANPQQVGKYRTNSDRAPDDVAVLGHYAYVTETWWTQSTGGGGLLHVIDVSDPAHPRPAGTPQPIGESSQLEVSGDYAYVTGGKGLAVIDVRDPANLRRVGGLEGVWGRLTLSGHYGYLAANVAGLLVIDISDPTDPQRVGASDDGTGEAGDVAVWGQYAYVTNWDHLRVIDISDPAHPAQLKRYDTSDWPHSLPVSPAFAYVPDPDETWLVKDVSDPANPQSVGGFKTIASATGVAVSGRYAYARGVWEDKQANRSGGRIEVIDLSDPAKPQVVGEYKGSGYFGAMTVSGHHVYLGENRGLVGFEVIDVSNPVQPQRVGGCELGGGAFVRGVTVSGGYVYVAATEAGLLVIDCCYPSDPQVIGRYAPRSGAAAHDVALSGHYAYVAVPGLADGVGVIDVSDPTNPRWVGGVLSGFDAIGVAVEGAKVYVAAGADGLLILKTSQLGPRFESSFLDAAGFHVFFQGELGQALRLQRSQDLKTWADWIDVTGTGNRQDVVDPGPGSQPRQFYRAVVP